jgi:hypothetical protein
MSIGLQAYLQGYMHEKTAVDGPSWAESPSGKSKLRIYEDYRDKELRRRPARPAPQTRQEWIRQSKEYPGIDPGTPSYGKQQIDEARARLGTEGGASDRYHRGGFPGGFQQYIEEADKSTKSQKTLRSILGGVKHIGKRYGEDFTKGTSDTAGTAADRTLEGGGPYKVP